MNVAHISEFDRAGNLLWDAEFAGGDTYRAYRHEWIGEPETVPAVKAAAASGGTTVHAIWNGATRVARWEILGSAIAGHFLSWIDSVAWDGFDTAVNVPGSPATVQVVARDERGRELGRSAVTVTGN